MKKHFIVLAALLLPLCAIAAQDWETLVEKAVAEMVEQRRGMPIEVVIEPIFIDGSITPSEFSRRLRDMIDYSAVKNGKYSVKGKSRGGPPTGRIEGTYSEKGNNIEVILTLLSDINQKIGTAKFKFPKSELENSNIRWLPENYNTQNEVKAQTKAIETLVKEASEPPSSRPAAKQNTFTIKAWPTSDDYIYNEGDTMQITLWADKNCYFKVYCVDAENNRQLIYPFTLGYNARDNFLRANTVRTIPEPNDNMPLYVHAPFGAESILVFASDEPLDWTEDEMEPINNTRSVSPRKNVEKTNTKSGSGVLVKTTFDYTTIPNTTDTLSYKKPDDMNNVVQELRTAIVQQQGGTFNGNEQSGTFIVGSFSGAYSVSRDTVTMKIVHPKDKTIFLGMAPRTRGAGNVYNFSFSKPADINQAVQKVRSGILEKGGSFDGNESAGNFNASGIAGRYSVSENVAVSILDKPFVLSYSLIEKEVRKFFGVK